MNAETNFEIDPWIRDLRWGVGSPFLMSLATAERGNSSLYSESGTFPINKEHAQLFAEKYSGHRVGYYFESLIEYWLKYIRGVEILARGYQVMEGNRTVGELDFVFRDERGQLNHWEAAAKFYLYCGDRTVKGSHYVGPNAQDTFELKREKIFAKQLPLSGRVFPEVAIRQAFVKGRIFYHPDSNRPDQLPFGLRGDHLRGIWLRQSELSRLEGGAGTKHSAYHFVKKPFWLSPECFKVSEYSPLSLREFREHLATHFSENKSPLLTSILVQEGGLWTESERIFVVADDWPESSIGSTA